MGRKKLIGTVTQKKGKADEPTKEQIKDSEPKQADSTLTKAETMEKKDKSKVKSKEGKEDKESKEGKDGKDKKIEDIVNGEYDLSDLDEGLDIDDFEDPEFFTEGDDEELGEDDEFMRGPEVMFDLFNSFFQYDNQNMVETLCQVRDSIDANSKCLLRVAHEIRNLHNAYMHINMEKGDDKALASIPKTV